ncbi:MAG: type II toxin-antitoxin system PemK/MazF family toxin [Dolichospermum sp.]|jgi:mRNA interferase MazF
MSETHTDFIKTGLKKTSLIRADKIATVHNSVFHKRIGTLPSDLFNQLEVALKQSLNIT